MTHMLCGPESPRKTTINFTAPTGFPAGTPFLPNLRTDKSRIKAGLFYGAGLPRQGQAIRCGSHPRSISSRLPPLSLCIVKTRSSRIKSYYWKLSIFFRNPHPLAPSSLSESESYFPTKKTRLRHKLSGLPGRQFLGLARVVIAKVISRSRLGDAGTHEAGEASRFGNLASPQL